MRVSLWAGANPADIAQELERAYGADAPDIRTIQRRKLTLMPDGSGPWTVSGATNAEEVRSVLPVVAELLKASRGTRALTRNEAAAVMRVRAAAPEVIPMERVFAAALFYVHGEDKERRGLDAFFALSPWSSASAWAEYQRLGVRAPASFDVWALAQWRTERPATKPRKRPGHAPASGRRKTVNLGTGEVRVEEDES